MHCSLQGCLCFQGKPEVIQAVHAHIKKEQEKEINILYIKKSICLLHFRLPSCLLQCSNRLRCSFQLSCSSRHIADMCKVVWEWCDVNMCVSGVCVCSLCSRLRQQFVYWRSGSGFSVLCCSVRSRSPLQKADPCVCLFVCHSPFIRLCLIPGSH